jgi:hypothetical protein
MKRLVAFITALIFVFLATGCNNVEPGITEAAVDEHNVFNRVSHSDVVGLLVEVSSINNLSGKTTLTVSWNNTTEHTVTYGEMYWIERLENGEWVDCSLQENVFLTIGYLLKANTDVSKEYTLTDMYGISIPGTYRFLSTCSVDMGDEKPTECSVWSEFVVE